MTKKKLKKEFPRVTLARITREMAQPRFAESARKEEEANHHATAKTKPPKRASEPV
jgi:histone H3/H4